MDDMQTQISVLVEVEQGGVRFMLPDVVRSSFDEARAAADRMVPLAVEAFGRGLPARYKVTVTVADDDLILAQVTSGDIKALPGLLDRMRGTFAKLVPLYAMGGVESIEQLTGPVDRNPPASSDEGAATS